MESSKGLWDGNENQMEFEENKDEELLMDFDNQSS